MMKKIRSAKILIIAVIWFIVCLGSPLLAQDGGELVRGKKYHPRMESVLGMLAEKYSQNKIVARDFALQRGIAFQNDVVTAILVPPLGRDASAIDRESLGLYGVTVEAASQHLLRARIPLSRLIEFAEKTDSVSYIRLPYTPLPASIISEGVVLTRAIDYHNAGYEGQNTRVAVIDLGFSELESVQNVGDLPLNVIGKDFTGTGLTTGTNNHGTKVAQIVYDMAPRAQLYFIKVADEVDLENAKDYCISQGVDVISHSWGWPNTNFTDGTGLVCDIANDARANDILWANAAGNATTMHYQHFFRDTDGDGWHEFSWTGDERQVFQGDPWHETTIFLTWDDWPTTAQDYDLYLYDSNLNLVASSTNLQTGTQPPTEKIVYIPASYGSYNIMIHNSNASGNEDLKLFTFNGGLWWATAAHSIWPPADAAGVIAAGAIDQANWQTGPQESYSSQGPTNDGRIKPDISGPDGVMRYADGGAGRGYGTSYAAPHVAGAACLLLSKYPHLTANEIQLTLEKWAVDMGEEGKDNIYGSGRLNLSLDDPSIIPPILYWTGETDYLSDGLNPEKGKISTQFVYRIKYTSEDNYAPKDGYPKVHILKGGQEIALSPFSMVEVDGRDTNYSDGKLYGYTTTFSTPGEGYSYYFEAEDLYNLQALGAPTSELSGPNMVLSLNLEDLVVYPNPFEPARGHSGIVFAELTSDANIRIFDLNGQEILMKDIIWQRSWFWDMRNERGEVVSRGTYIYFITNSQGEKKIGKIAVIK